MTIDLEAERLVRRMRERLRHFVPGVIHASLQSALDGLEDELGPHEAMQGLRDDVAQLETAYG